MAVPTGPNAPGATAALVLGIVSFVLSIFGLITAILALVFGFKAKRLIAQSGGTLSGGGMALAGRVLGIVYLSLVSFIVVAAVIFVLVANFAGDGSILADETVTLHENESYFQGFVIHAASGQVNFTVESTSGTIVSAGIYPVDDADDPIVTSFSGVAAYSEGNPLAGGAELERGAYSLMMTCESGPKCRVHFTLRAAETEEPEEEARVLPPAVDIGGLTNSWGEPIYMVEPATSEPSLPEWQPAPETVPVGVYLFIDRTAGTFHGKDSDTPIPASRRVLTPADSHIAVDHWTDRLRLSVTQENVWDLTFMVPEGADPVEAGYRHDFMVRDPRRATSGWVLAGTESGIYCGTGRSSFSVDDVAVGPDGAVESLVLRFETQCERSSSVVHGKLVWSKQEWRLPCEPHLPPSGIPGSALLPGWRPDSPPTADSWLLIDGQPGEPVTEGQTYIRQAPDAWLSVSSGGSRLSAHSSGAPHEPSWSVDLTMPIACDRLTRGYYPDLHREGLGNAFTGDLDVHGGGVACSIATSAFAIDEVTYDEAGMLQHLVLRFEHHCHDAEPALRGMLVWNETE